MKSQSQRIISREEAATIVRLMVRAENPPVPLDPELAEVGTVTDRWDCPLWGIEEPAWYVTVPWNDGLDGRCLRSSRIIAISKVGGAVLYDGSANDEG